MCFSSEASFTAAGLLSIATYAVKTQVVSKKQNLLVVIVGAMALMQFVEGILWLQLASGSDSSFWGNFAGNFFILFGAFFWPIWIPFSVFMVEDRPKRRKWLKAIFLFSLLYGVACLGWLFFFPEPFSATIVHRSIQYQFGTLHDHPVTNHAFSLLYLGLIILPCFLSSLGGWIPGTLLLLSYLIAKFLYQATFFSVWCFYGSVAIASMYVMLHRYNKKKL